MLIQAYYFTNAYERFDAINSMLERKIKGNKVDVNEDIMFSNIDNAIADIYSAFEMMDFTDTKQMGGVDITIQSAKNMIKLAVKQYNELRKEERPVEEYKEVIELFIGALMPIYSNNRLKNLSGSYWMDSEDFNSTWEYGKYEIPKEIIKMVADKISGKKECNILDVNALNLGALNSFHEYIPQAKLYGVTNRSAYLTKEEREQYERLAIADPLGAVKISNDCFDIVVATPPISLERKMDARNFIPEERATIERAYKYLRKGGLLIYSIPRAYLSKHLVTYISRNLGNVRVIEDVYSAHGKDHHTVVITGTKRAALERELDPKVFMILRGIIANPERIDALEDVSYHIIGNPVQVAKFRSNKLDDAEMNMMFEGSSAMKDFWNTQRVVKISDNASHPLLPFNVGQLGLVLTSGCLDGVVEEGNNCSHVIKGRVVKIVEDAFDTDNGTVTEHKITSNRVEISMFLPDGTYKCLA